MRLMIVTFVIDETHPALAWQAFVVRELAKKAEKIYVLTSQLGQAGEFPSNVEIIVPPVRPFGIPHRFGGRWAFNRDIYRLCKKHHIDAVFIHMAMEWAYILYPAFRLLQLPVVMWYAHGSVTKKLKLAIGCVDKVVTSTPEGCRVEDKKIRVIGQAINTSQFNISKKRLLTNILYVGRISQRKRVDLIYQVHKQLDKISEDSEHTCFDIVGAALNEIDLRYDQKLRAEIWQDGMEHDFKMWGLVPYARIPEFYESAFLHINVSETGSMDKTVMEALASGCPVLTSNAAFFDLLREYPEFLITDERPEAIAEQIRQIYKSRHDYDPVKLRAIVLDNHDLYTYADRVLDSIQQVIK